MNKRSSGGDKVGKKARSKKKLAGAISGTASAGAQQHSKADSAASLPVAGIVASAGGLTALKQFFSAMPARSGIAFIVVPHLDPEHESPMVDLLSRYTPMPVVPASQGLRLQPDHVYVIPPGKFLSLQANALLLSEPPESRGPQIGLDFFLQSLALACGERAIGIVLSGTGAHGSRGLQAVKGSGGMTMVQDPASAEFDQMPRNAIMTGMVDYMLPVDAMPEALLHYVEHRRNGSVVAEEYASRLLSAVLKHSNDAIIVLDTSGAITYWNRGAEKLYGYPRGEAVAMNTLDMVPKKYRAVMCEILRRISNGEAAGSFEIQRKTRDGRVLDVGLTITRLRDSAGKVRTLAFTERDITRQKLREKQLLAANVNLEKKIRQRTAELARRTEEFRTLANNVPALFAYIDSDQRYRFVNHRHAQVWGRPTTDIIGRTVEELLGSQQFEKIRANVKAALAGEYITYEQSFEFGDRSLVMSINYVPDRDSQGQVRGLYALIVDITEQKRIQQSLVRQQQRLSAIVNTLADGLVTLDSGGIIEAFNPAAEHMFGYPTEAVTGKPFTLLFAEPVTATQPQILDRFLTREDRPIYHNITGQHRDGTDFPLEISIRQIDHRDSYVCLMRDCSERKQLEREIIETSTLEQEYFGREIHDGIGQELTAVTMLAVSLKSQLERAQYSAATVAMDQLIQHLQRTLGQAKALATGLSPIDIGPDGLTDALSALVERIEAASGIHCRFERSVSALDIDENTATHLYRIAQEAINNAVKHARARNIAVQLRREAGTIVLAVEDDGIGIPAKLPSKSKLGLHIMRYRARIIGGYLEIKRLAGGGTRIQCVLPGAHSNTVASA